MSDDDTAFEFPCDFPIKMMGRDTPEFRDIARSLVEKHTGRLDDDAVRTSLSRNGRFVSVTVTFSAQSREQLDTIYREVTAHEAVLIAL
jgi:uncharacterized protein